MGRGTHYKCHCLSGELPSLSSHLSEEIPAPKWSVLTIGEVRPLRAGLGSTVLTQDESGSVLNEIPVSQDVIPGGELGCHSETDDQLVLDSGWNEEETAGFSYFL